MDYYNATLERIDHNGKLVNIVSEITIEAIDIYEAQLVAHNWVLTFLTFSNCRNTGVFKHGSIPCLRISVLRWAKQKQVAT